MTQAGTTPPPRTRKPVSNVYTALAAVAAVVLTIAVVYITLVNLSQTDGVRQGAPNPFYVIPD